MTGIDQHDRLSVTELQWRERHASVDKRLEHIAHRLEKQDDTLTAVATTLARVEQVLENQESAKVDQETRIRSLETARNWLAGVIAAAGAAGAASLASIWDFVTGGTNGFS